MLRAIGKKVSKAGKNPEEGSRVEQYWGRKSFKEVAQKLRPGFRFPTTFDPYDQEKIIARYNLKGFDYGNWVNQDLRFNFLLSGYMAMSDLSTAIGTSSNLGLSRQLGIAYGARGKGGNAAAHFEPCTFMINLTRNNGWHSLGHEYGHALDSELCHLSQY